ncbi:hypothetical protein [Coxiella endosymbiont of Ornithodoros amblus]|uniref:hypothetical protein n=1 Tax=Coxiella endosymbiont of Ornithodoros amblus TaxID=1656166 RepID=UPI00244E1FBA|nr:hypothetical protein [Coxiella endosymbiont of Ornithodoros amblus]
MGPDNFPIFVDILLKLLAKIAVQAIAAILWIRLLYKIKKYLEATLSKEYSVQIKRKTQGRKFVIRFCRENAGLHGLHPYHLPFLTKLNG